MVLFAQQPCNCEGNFKWVKETFEKNDAGFDYVIQQKGMAAYEEHNKAILSKIKKATDKEQCAVAMREWLLFFRKSHHAIIPVNTTKPTAAASSISLEVLALSEEQVKQGIPDASTPLLEGIWTTSSYKIGIVKKDKGYKGIILTSGNPAWKPGYVKLNITADSAGAFYMGDFSANKFDKAVLVGKNTLQLGTVFLKREYPVFPGNDDAAVLYAKEMATSVPFMQQLSDKTILFRIPTFEDYAKHDIDSLLKLNDALLKRTQNLVIDIRNNGGGSDISYYEIIPLLYTNPIRSINTTFLSTPLNNSRMEGFLATPGLSDAEKKALTEAVNTLKENPGKFVNLNKGKIVDVGKLDTIFPFPKNVAIIINNQNGSTSEEFLLAARQSKKVKLFGVTTFGVLDISNTYVVESPDKQFKLGYALSKSLRIPDLAIDGKGIMPDYYIDKSIPDAQWLNYVVGVLEQ
ncbi:peptidase S41 [Chitinophaga sp. G-6-1-13]|uniref:Peptidase S41 n=2 Tax=Chitinophaga fulva TaxID=2728842 RepID=A0A848GKI7_9BACT|nr:peptidase S41 [Chitinophaga fulva]